MTGRIKYIEAPDPKAKRTRNTPYEKKLFAMLAGHPETKRGNLKKDIIYVRFDFRILTRSGQLVKILLLK